MCCYSTKQKTLLLQQQHSGVELSELRVNATFCKLGGCSFVEPAVGQQVGGFLSSYRPALPLCNNKHRCRPFCNKRLTGSSSPQADRRPEVGKTGSA